MAAGENTAWKRLEGAIARLEAEQAKLRRSVGIFQDTLVELQSSVDGLGHNLGQFHDSLGSVRAGAAKLGAKSRKLATTMDGYLARHGEAANHGEAAKAAAPAPRPLPALPRSRAA